ncbi:hypothetical protein [Streptomyces sp. NPDC002573]|uniref:hypothetical protein n=1 Tax=Streptomyces sp. NPDC002573 TaxID=3364651 RepID=UPI00367FFC65
MSARIRPEAARTLVHPRVVPRAARETEPERLWQWLLQNQRGAVVAHAVRRETNAVICQLRFRLF